jgi:hypothetical protein
MLVPKGSPILFVSVRTASGSGKVAAAVPFHSQNMFEKVYSWGDQLALTLRALRTGYGAAG